MKTHFKAPWGTGLKWSSTFVTAFALTITISDFPLSHYQFRSNDPWAPLVCRAFPALVLLGSLPFIVRGFAIHDGTLYVRRLFWDTQIDLNLLQGAEINPEALRGGYRTCGNGGLYGFTGDYWSKQLGY